MKLSLRSNDVACATQMMLCLAAQMKKSIAIAMDFLEVTIGFEPMDNGVADRGLTTWLRHQTTVAPAGARLY